MSWSVNTPEAKTLAELEDAHAAFPGIEGYGDLSEGALAQFEAAAAAAHDVVASGAVGDPATHKFHVSLHGHANPGHEPHEGYAVDGITVGVTQAT